MSSHSTEVMGESWGVYLVYLFSSILTCAIDLLDLVIRPRPTWSPEELFRAAEDDASVEGEDTIPQSMKGKVVVITGGHSGCGLECVRWMGQGVKRIYLLGRSPVVMRETMEALKSEVGREFWIAELVFVECDLASLGSVKSAADAFFQLEEEKLRGELPDLSPNNVKVGIDLLFLNAGVLTNNREAKTSDGFELTWGVNCLGHHALLGYLLPALEVSAKAARDSVHESDEDDLLTPTSPRVIWTGSIAHSVIVSPSVSYYPLSTKLLSWCPRQAPYARSKASILLDLYYMLPHLTNAGIIAVVVHPGVIHTPIQREFRGTWQKRWIARLIDVQSRGCINLLWSAFVATPEEIHGKYVTQWCRIGNVTRMVRDQDLITKHGKFMDKVIEEMGSQTTPIAGDNDGEAVQLQGVRRRRPASTL